MKTFAAGFYQANAAMLIFLFGTVVIYCFFINTLGAVPSWAFTIWNLVITLTLVSNPMIMGIFFLLCFFYGLKSLRYVSAQLKLGQYLFLYYSSSSFPLGAQFKTWFLVQFKIFLPLYIYSFFALLIGFNFGHYLIPVLILLYLLILNAVLSLLYVRMVNRLAPVSDKNLFRLLTHTWPKPLFCLYTFQVFNRSKLSYLLTKGISWLCITAMFSLFTDAKDPLVLAAAIMLSMVTAHLILLYNEYRFNETQLYFHYNFPCSKVELFFGFTLNYLLLMLPEVVWFIKTYSFASLALLCFGLALLCLFRSLLCYTGLNIKKYLVFIFLLFNVIFLLILSQFTWILVPFIFLAAYLIYSRNYLNKILLN